MPKQTLLELTQDILGEMESDQVNSISDTIESEDVAKLVRQVYKEIVVEHDVPSKRDIMALEGLGNTAKPTHMTIPESVDHLSWVKYDTRVDVSGDKVYSDITRLDPIDFLNIVNARPSTDTDNYQVVQYSANIPLIIGKVAAPTYWTSFDDSIIVFDSYDSTVDTTLQSSKSLCEVFTHPSLALDDDSQVDLPQNLEILLYTQALNRALIGHKGMDNPKTERVENRFRVRAMRNKWRAQRQTNTGPDFGRR